MSMMARPSALVAWVALLGTLSAGCTSPAQPGAPATQARSSAESSQDRVTRDSTGPLVVAISVDGLAPRALRRLGRRGAPAMHRMIAKGASSLNARTILRSTETLPNHTSMLTGRPATGLPGAHGTTVNEDPGGTLHLSAGEHVESVFSVVHDHGGSTALYASKSKFALFDRTWGIQWGGPDTVGVDDGVDKIDHVLYSREQELVSRLVTRLRTRPDTLSFLHLALPDVAGHEHGFMRRPYLRAVRRTDALVSRVLAAITEHGRLRGRTTVILTSDHGGRGRDHSDPELRANFTIPFLVWGSGVAKGADLYRLNGHRRDPGSTRPRYGEAQPVRNADLANLVTDLLGVPRVPGSRFNRSQGLEVSR